MIDVNDATKIARMWVAEWIDLKPTAWPSDTYGSFGPPEDYVMFRVAPPERVHYVGGDRYIAVRKLTGKVHDLGLLGE
jgi:hypothetical protein